VLLTLFVMAHSIWFCVWLRQYVYNGANQGSRSIAMVTLPMILLLAYTIVLIPFIIICMLLDFRVKQEGVMTWHGDSLGILI